MEHGLSRTRIYRIFAGMKQRCYNKNATGYKMYGGKGVKICQEWLDDFQTFYNWSMENGYADKLTIDRIDSKRDYCPDNCRWITFELNFFRTHHDEETAIRFAEKYPFHGKLGRLTKAEQIQKQIERNIEVIPKEYPESNLRKMRKKRNYRMEKIASMLGVSIEEYQLMEMGETYISDAELLRLAKILNVSIDNLIPLPEPIPFNKLLNLLETKNIVKVAIPKS